MFFTFRINICWNRSFFIFRLKEKIFLFLIFFSIDSKLIFRVEEYVRKIFEGTSVKVEVIKGQETFEKEYPCLVRFQFFEIRSPSDIFSRRHCTPHGPFGLKRPRLAPPTTYRCVDCSVLLGFPTSVIPSYNFASICLRTSVGPKTYWRKGFVLTQCLGIWPICLIWTLCSYDFAFLSQKILVIATFENFYCFSYAMVARGGSDGMSSISKFL